MAKSQQGVAVSEGLKRAADVNACEVCGRKGAIVDRTTRSSLGGILNEVYCRWARQGKCSRPDRIRRA